MQMIDVTVNNKTISDIAKKLYQEQHSKTKNKKNIPFKANQSKSFEKY